MLNQARAVDKKRPVNKMDQVSSNEISQGTPFDQTNAGGLNTVCLTEMPTITR
ncbi:MAG: hypothetical protein JST17_08660 [Bacteroidetes bacterium]|nr:hypothetical protein [Bacteroidota bacterium]MBS1930751.1 hypothetical protein [Bacteroidota bacterium]